MSSDVKVGIKLRPLVKREIDQNLSIHWVVKENSIISLDQETKKSKDNEFHFDHIFDVTATNSNVFDSIIRPVVDGTLNGFNGTIFCYGQFDSGKTYTMTGTSEDPGIIPLSIEYIFNIISNTIKREFLLRVSYLEICDEKINDLLNKNQIDLKLYKNDNGQVVVNCKEEIINSSESILSKMKEGMRNKKIQEADRNENIKSHNIFRITIESRELEGDSRNIVQVSQLNFVDLAGFEKVYSTNATQEHQIDVSLSTFQSLFLQLSKSEDAQEYTNYNNSKLTELLQSSLSGDAFIALICTVKPVDLDETYNTLMFASQSKSIKTWPQRNEVMTDASLLIRYSKLLTKLETELRVCRNSSEETKEVVSNKLQCKYRIDHLLEEHIRLLKNRIISGYKKDCDELVKHKSRKKQTLLNSGTSNKQYLPVFNNKTDLPTIIEVSSETQYKENIMQSVDAINQTLQTTFTDFELDLIDCTAGVKCTGGECSVKSVNDNSLLIPEKQDTSVQTSSNEASPDTPKSTLRKYILERSKDFTELLEFTTLEKQLICEEKHCSIHNSEGQTSKQSICSGFTNDEGTIMPSSNLIVQLQEENNKLTEELELKKYQLNEIQDDVQSLKLDIEMLKKTIYSLTNENTEMSNKLSVEKERMKQAEAAHQKTIDELYTYISNLTNEKVYLESDIMVLNDQLESERSKIPEKFNDEQLAIKYQSKIDALKTENIELSAVIVEKNKELENIKESKSLLYDHECIYKDKVTSLTEKIECLVTENSDLSTELIGKIEENDTLKKECDILKNKMSLMKNTDSDESDIEQLKLMNNSLKAEIIELKMKITMLTDENTQISNNLLENMDDFDKLCNEKSSSNSLHLSATLYNSPERNEMMKKMLQEESNEELVNKVVMLQDEVNHLSRLNKKLSDLKLSSCNQCAHLKNLNENRRTLKVETKVLNHKLTVLQKRFDQKCADVEALKLKANQELNLSFADTSLNVSFADSMNMSFVEDRIQHLSNELQTARNNHEKLSALYIEKCDEVENLHAEAVDTKSSDDDCKRTFKNETRLEQFQKSLDKLKKDIDEIKSNNTNFFSEFTKFKMEKMNLLREIDALKNVNETLQQKVFDREILATTATEKAQILETEVLSMNKEIELFSAKEKMMQSEKLTLEVVVEDLRAEKENKDVFISKLNRTIDELNECITSLKSELDSVTNQNHELTASTETIERKYKEELQIIREQCDKLEREKAESIEAEGRAILRTKELETDIEKLKTDLKNQEHLYEEVKRKIFQLESLLQESENEKDVLKKKLQILEVQLIDSKDDLVSKYKGEFETLTKKFAEYTKESEIKLIKINETLNKYVEDNDNLTVELAKLRDIELKLKNLQNKDEHLHSEEKTLIDANKLKEELDAVKECMMKELRSFKREVNCAEFLNKTANDIFIIFLHTIMSKEEEIIKQVKEEFEKEKQELEDERRQSADSEKRTTLWAKELENETEKLQIDLTRKECLLREQQDKVRQLEHLLRESNCEREILKEKMETLKIDYNNLQSEFDKQCRVDIPQREDAIIVAQKREKEIQETFKRKEIELQSKLKNEIDLYEKKIKDLNCSIETYKTKNMELKNSIEGLEANQKQLRNIIEANSLELKMNKQTIHKITVDLEQLTETYNEVNREAEQKTCKIENITALLKKKCDMLSEYKAKLESVMPDYEMLKNQVKDRKENIERCKEEIAQLKIEKEKQIELIRDKLNAEEITNIGLNKQLNELNNKNIALIEEMDNLKEKCEELQRTNAKLEKKIRNSTSKMKAETEMEELKDINKRLQNNLDGASNRISELQENKNKILKELVDLKGQYDLLSQENIEVKKSLSLYRSKQSSPRLLQEDSKYDALLQEKNKTALELEGNKLLLKKKEKEIRENVSKIENLSIKKNELDNQLKECTVIIHERNEEILHLKDKLLIRQAENKLVNDLEEKLKILEVENKKLENQLKVFQAKSQINMKQIDDTKLHNENVLSNLKKESLDLQAKLNNYENKPEMKSNGSSRSTSPAFEKDRRRRSRNEIFNQRRQLENVDTDIPEAEETCQILRKKIRELELELVSKNGQITALEIQIQSENFPYQKKCKELEELLLTFRKKNTELSIEVRNLQRTLNDVNALECDTCRRWRINKRDQACQTSSTSNKKTQDRVKIMKLEKDNELMKNICHIRNRQIKDLENKVQELEAQAASSSKCIELLKENFNHQYTSTVNLNKQFNSGKNTKPAMKENIPANALKFTKPSNYGRSI
ncbi:uncharacterized protein LOC143425292 [Xylocopa sonorina]|uniref:uncharacterized protein LOC143425292 n=1 Tax=Xylocopa sonorina TaxID=1818115 RepID=UPI00403B2874